MKTTKLMREMLLHRLGAGDAICDTIAESRAELYFGGLEGIPDDAWNAYREEQMEGLQAAVERLWGYFQDGGKVEALSGLSNDEKDVLVDSVSGSVWIGCMEGNCNESLIARHVCTGNRLAAMVSAATGIHCEFPIG